AIGSVMIRFAFVSCPAVRYGPSGVFSVPRFSYERQAGYHCDVVGGVRVPQPVKRRILRTADPPFYTFDYFADTLISNSARTFWCSRTRTGYFPTDLMCLSSSMNRLSSSGPPALFTAPATSSAVTEPNSFLDPSGALASTRTVPSPSRVSLISLAWSRSRIRRDSWARRIVWTFFSAPFVAFIAYPRGRR